MKSLLSLICLFSSLHVTQLKGNKRTSMIRMLGSFCFRHGKIETLPLLRFVHAIRFKSRNA